ncbi:MAG: hypothetical protein Q9159_000942 [Coniocarpon cinnabarinum]
MASFPPAAMQPVLHEVTTLLKERQETVAVAETLYTLPSRIAYANWTPRHLQDYAGPTPSIVQELAENTRSNIAKAEQDIGKGHGPTYVIAESGTAGPTGGTSRNRQPGYVALAVSTPKGTATREIETGTSERTENMQLFAKEALVLLRDVIKGEVKL